MNRRIISLLVLSSAASVVSTAVAQTRTLADPTELASTRTGAKELHVNLDVEYGDFTTYNPATGKNDAVHLRTYAGKAVGPTIRMSPGDSLKVDLNNKLPIDPACPEVTKDHNTPNCFNITNLHTHGFHVSPKDNSDNVFLEVKPGKSQDYEFKLPADHPAGTFWYHSHRHGSTALQVSSGMEGALIVRGTRTYADKAKNGIADIDTVLKQTGGKKVTERIALFQQVQYSCVNKDGNLTWNCSDPANKDNIGQIAQFKGQFGPSSWKPSGRYTTINGLVQPNVPVHAGQIYRWRLIHGGVRDTIALRITKGRPMTPNTLLMASKGIAPENELAWTTKNCLLNQSIPQFEFAVDGLTRRAMVQKGVNILQPGYRSDVLTVFPEKGVYCVLDDSLAQTSEINSNSLTLSEAISQPTEHKDRRLLALVVVQGEGKVNVVDLKSYLGRELYNGNPELPKRVRDDLRELKIAEFSPHADLPASPDNGHQDAIFNIQLTPVLQFQVNGKPFEANRIDHLLKLGTTDEWEITSTFDNHPFHIHVNPFQIISITKKVTDASGKSTQQSIFDSSGHCTELDLKDKDGNPAPDPQYCDQIGVFRDTIFAKQDYHILVRTKYETFDGDFVLHCHILDHEDQGMMQNVRIEDPAHPMTTPFGGGMQMMH
jgi:L-ascorbate oxidase